MDLLSYSQGGGCGCKIDSGTLSQILESIPKNTNPDVLNSFLQKEDSATIKLNDSIIQTSIDFSSPIVNDLYAFGQISAANSLSDIYASGGIPKFATVILGVPKSFSVEETRKILSGVVAICQSVGVDIVGGHTINNQQPICGLSVIGLQNENYSNLNTILTEDCDLFITKPLGTGLSYQSNKLDDFDTLRLSALESMIEVNDLPDKFDINPGILGMTDVTGYGLLGHLVELGNRLNVQFSLNQAAIPIFEGLDITQLQKLETSSGKKNWINYGANIKGLTEQTRIIISDPQTNGGLLLLVDRCKSAELIEKYQKKKMQIYKIGEGIVRNNQNSLIECQP